ncbi:flagellar protein FlgN [Candidatus Magnetobacterium casense]|uniref:Flagellar protein FlgN n=1 Tax=Candidatus Magnetobacterium casense TaxID=1455061 RepID=A0ABS6RVZ9_9BACT|nr:flagellar protein FlgN [Candidatus Magnetobacterium casensis]MBV6340525.1 flagellar protein FlgN [Candidatus Magnetobacterium casensis]
MKTTDALKKILNEQVIGYKALFELLQVERQSLVDFNEQSVERLSKEKDTLVLKLRLLEDERVRLMRKYSLEASKEAKARQVQAGTNDGNNQQVYTNIKADISLKELAEITGDSVFLDIRSKLRSLLQGIEELNDYNKILIERSINYLKNNLNFLRTLGINPNVVRKGFFITKEA